MAYKHLTRKFIRYTVLVSLTEKKILLGNVSFYKFAFQTIKNTLLTLGLWTF